MTREFGLRRPDPAPPCWCSVPTSGGGLGDGDRPRNSLAGRVLSAEVREPVLSVSLPCWVWARRMGLGFAGRLAIPSRVSRPYWIRRSRRSAPLGGGRQRCARRISSSARGAYPEH